MKKQTLRRCTPSRLALAMAPVLGAAAWHPAVAQDAAATATLPTVTVTSDWLGTPTAATARKHPGARSVIDEKGLTESGARNLEDALRQVPGVTITDESGTGILPNIGVRGLNPLRSEQVLLLQDGIPMTLAPYGQTGASLFPLTLQSVEAVDVARGGVAVHYGPNNVGGVINFITKRIPVKPSFTANETVTVSRTGRVLTDSYVRAGGFVNDRLGLQVQANVIDGQGERAHSGTSVQNLMLDGEWFPTDRSEVRAGLQRYVTRNELSGALTPRAYAQDRSQSTRPLDRFDGDTTRGHLTYMHQFGNGVELTWKNFGHRSTRVFEFGNATNADNASTLRQTAPRDFVVYGTEPSLTVDIAGSVPQKIMVGARYMREEVDYKVDSRNLATGAYSVTRDWRFENDAYAAYVSDTFSLLDGKLKVTPGVRHEDVRLFYRNNATGAQTRDNTQDWLPGLDVGYQASREVFLFANAHRSLRPVQFTQITFGGDLQAERAKNYEAGVRWSATPSLDLAATAFRFSFDNKLEFVNATTGFRNLGQARHQGAELEAKWRPQAVRGLELGGAYTHVDTEQLSGSFRGKELPYAPRQQLALATTYRTAGWTWNLNGHYQSAMFSDGANTEAENATGSVGRIPSYWLWNAHVGYAFTWSGTKMKAGLGINNLFNRDYYFRGVDYSQGRMPQPSRAVMATLQVDL
jgi:Fe(3+) dicitrate transport protein